MEKNTNISLQILILNDLYHTHTIDRSIYDKAIQKLTAMTDTNEQAEFSKLLATA